MTFFLLLTSHVIDILVGREYLDHGPFFRVVYIILFNSYVVLATWRCSFAPRPVVYCWLCVYVCAEVCIPASLSVATSVPLFFPGTPGRSSGLKSLSVLHSKSRQKSLPINFFSLEKGIRGFNGKGMGEGGGSEPRKTPFFLCNISLGLDSGLGSS